MLYSLYAFEDDSPDDDPCGGVVALATEVPIKHVYREQRLLELGSEMPFNEAFAVWASESLGLYDTAHRLADAGDFDVDALECARGDVERVMGKAGQAWPVYQAAMREALQPFTDQGMCMRAIACYLQIPLVDVVRVCVGPRAGKRANAICDLEEAIVDGALERESQRALMNRLGVKDSFGLLAHLRDMHVPSEVAA